MPYLMRTGKWRAKRMINGEIRTKVFPTKQEAKKWEAAQVAGTWQKSRTRTASLLDFLNAYLAMAKSRFVYITYQEKRLAVKRLFKVVSPLLAAEDLTPADIMNAMSKTALDVSGNAANKIRKNLIPAWTWGKRYCGLPAYNPFLEVESFPADENPRYVPPEEDFWKVYEVAEPHEKLILLFFLHTGARKMEAFRLKWEDIDFSRRTIQIGTRKTGHGGMEYSTIPMTTELRNALAEHKIRSRSDYVLVDPHTGQPYDRHYGCMALLCRKASVKPFCFHAIRHLSATILAYADMNIPTIQAMLRHKNPNTTARYIKKLGVRPETVDRVFENRSAATVIPFPGSGTIGT
jgi:integrase